MSHQNRITITVDDELAEQLDRLKQEQYYATSHAEMLRELIRLGLSTKERNGERKRES